MIVIEGADGSGKTTLLEHLQRDIPKLELVPRHCNSEGPFSGLAEWVITSLRESIHPHHLYDRHPLISEPIYGPIVRGYPEVAFTAPNWYLAAWSHFASLRPLIIFCLPPLDNVRDNVRNSFQMKGVDKAISAIYYSYYFLYSRMNAEGSLVPVVRWDYTHPSALNNYRALVQRIRSERPL